MKLENQITGNAGMFWASWKLSLAGFTVLPTSRNTRGLDLVAYDSTLQNFVGIQVKTLTRRSPVPLGFSLDKVAGDWWVIINRIAADEPSVYVMHPDEVKACAAQDQTGHRRAYWLPPKAHEQEQFHNAWHRITSRAANLKAEAGE